MSISTAQKLNAAYLVNKFTPKRLRLTRKSVNQVPESIQAFDSNIFEVFFSEAEAQVIASKAKKAGLSVNEYMRNTALGFPVQ